MPLIDRYLELAVQQRASDLHFSSGEPVRMRVDGDLIPLDEAVMSSADLENMLLEIATAVEREKYLSSKNLDKSYFADGIGNFRVNIFQTRRGIAAVLRTIPTKVPTLEDLGLPEVVRKLTELGKGLVLVTGPTGSGKSTTLAAMLNHINQNFPYHILTAEDPVEFVHVSKQSLINQREIGNSCITFADALKYALREDPDVILVGEMRDLETIALALTAAETGHLVFGTLHTRGAAPSIDRIIDSFPANQQAMIRTMLAESLAAVISQALLKRADGKGRVAAYEIMVVNHAISNLIREGKTFQIPSIIQTARKEGMILMDGHIKELVQKGLVTAEEAAGYLEESAGVSSKKAGAPTPIRPIPIRGVGGAAPSPTGGRPPVLKGAPVLGGAPPPIKGASAPSASVPVTAPPPASVSAAPPIKAPPPPVAAAPPVAPRPSIPVPTPIRPSIPVPPEPLQIPLDEELANLSVSTSPDNEGLTRDFPAPFSASKAKPIPPPPPTIGKKKAG